ncbi:pyridoxine 5'-phosphate synthase [Pseudovibrio exalbescens]|uniref:Pyridoxine 5'-phosphate synthase n=1 Tax=Pseudovibrio exalbescens TaxID=197461 RepID=A0A1U7JKS6_9HYPH|nr:pyridoxine 5'-phosphate synthase [Pseudovibrio exalbescens]OKL45356.1 pyridoxine 5'-phosphate synthase [Pseudovibrio exalbescens]
MSTQSRLSVNVNAVAVLRNRRDLPWPSVTGMARIALTAGAKGITVHPRPDERHIRKTDVADLTALINDEFPSAELCLEGYPSDSFMALVEKHRPAQVLFVPDDPTQTTSDHGWDFEANDTLLRTIIASAKSWGVRTSLFVDPNPEEPAKAKAVGAERMEIYTGPYGACYDDPAAAEAELDKVIATAEAGRAEGLAVNAGHDLTVANIPALIERAPYISEMSIGHGFVADALIYGFEESVRRFRRALGEIK